MQKIERTQWKDGMNLNAEVFQQFDYSITLRDSISNLSFLNKDFYGIFEVNNQPLSFDNQALITDNAMIIIQPFKGLTRKGFVITNDDEISIPKEEGSYFVFYTNSEIGKRLTSEQNVIIKTDEKYKKYKLLLTHDIKDVTLQHYLLIGKFESSSNRITNFIPPCMCFKLADNDLLRVSYNNLLKKITNTIEVNINTKDFKVIKIFELVLSLLTNYHYDFTCNDMFIPLSLHKANVNFAMMLLVYLSAFKKLNEKELKLDRLFNDKINGKQIGIFEFLNKCKEEPFDSTRISDLYNVSCSLFDIINQYVSCFNFVNNTGGIIAE